MTYKVNIHNDAYLDIEKAYDYYYNISHNVAANFDKELHSAYKTLSKNPFFKIRYKDYRAFPLKKFPYIIVFTVEEQENTVSIYSVFHTSQNPDKLPK